MIYEPVDTGRKLNVHKTSRRRPGRLLKVLCTLNLGPVCTEEGSCTCKGSYNGETGRKINTKIPKKIHSLLNK